MRERAKGLGADAIIPTEERSEYREPGFMYNAFLGGYQSLPGGRVPILRGYAVIYEVNRTARAAAYREPGSTDGRVESAFRLTGDYVFLRDLDGLYFGAGMEYASNSVGYGNSTARGEWDSFFASAGVGYLLRIGRNVHVDARLALNARLTGEEQVDVGGRQFVPDQATPAFFIGVGANF